MLATSASAQWTQWGGPRRDFVVPEVALAKRWKGDEPRVVWEHELGNGNASLVVHAGLVFAIHGEGKTETVSCFDAASGKQQWSRSYDVSYEAYWEANGGPHSTPLAVGDSLFTVSIDAKLHAFDIKDGTVRWMRDLVLEFDCDLPQSGYAASPIAWGELVILPGLGAPGFGAIALRQENGEVAWARHAFLSSHASPILIETSGIEHLVFHGMNRLVGLEPSTGDLMWSKRLRSDAVDNVVFSPVWDAKRQLILVSHAYDRNGARALKLSRSEGEWRCEQAWSNRRLSVEHSNGVRFQDTLISSDGGDPAFTVAIELDSGKSRFKQRGLGKANFLVAGETLIVLEENGTLHLAELGESGLEILASRTIMKDNAWAAPILVGKRLYLRDRFDIRVIELP